MHYYWVNRNLTVAITCCLGLVLVLTPVIFSKIQGDDSTTFGHIARYRTVLCRLPFGVEMVFGEGTQFSTQFINAVNHGRSLFNLVQLCNTFSNILL